MKAIVSQNSLRAASQYTMASEGDLRLVGPQVRLPKGARWERNNA
ncbi:MAG TPA: hypothetical protein VIF83_06750 [Gemmatimonadaceae bacterium]